MTTPPTAAPVALEEQIAMIAHAGDLLLPAAVREGIRASLRELAEHRKRIRTAERPEEPPCLKVWRNDPQTFARSYQDALAHIDALTTYADRLQADWEKAAQLNDNQSRHVYAAESALAKVVKGLREPTEEMITAYMDAQSQSVLDADKRLARIQPRLHCADGIKAMSAELLRDLASDTTEGNGEAKP